MIAEVNNIEFLDVFNKFTTTNFFIVPVLGIPREKLYEHTLENAYVHDEIKNINYKNCIYLLFRPAKIQAFEEFLEEQRRKGVQIIEEYDYSNRIMVLCKYADKWKDDIDLILQGKFSKVSENFKNIFPKYKKVMHLGTEHQAMSIQHQIFDKHKDIKDYWNYKYGLEFEEEDEVWSFYKEREIFTQKLLNSIS